MSALPLEGEQGNPTKDQRGAAATAACLSEEAVAGSEKGKSPLTEFPEQDAAAPHHHLAGKFEWVEIGFSAQLDAELVPHHHSRTEQKENPMKITDEMVSRFLAWQLPKEFAPDGGVAFTPPQNPHHAWPVGTNLLTATQARVMLEHVLVAEPAPAREPVHNDWSKAKAKVLAKYPAAQYEAMQGYLPPYGHIVWINHKRDAPSDRGYGLSNATSEQEAWLEAARNLPAPAREPGAVEEVKRLVDMPTKLLATNVVGSLIKCKGNLNQYGVVIEHLLNEIQKERDEELDRLRAENEKLKASLYEEIQLRPHWAKGYSSDSVAAQCADAAIRQLWELLGAKDQTEAVMKLKGGVVVPRATLERWLPTMEAGANCNRSSDDAELRAMLAAAKEQKHG